MVLFALPDVLWDEEYIPVQEFLLGTVGCTQNCLRYKQCNKKIEEVK